MKRPDGAVLPAILSLAVMVMITSPVLAQPGGRGGFGGGGTFGLLQNEDVREELGVVDDQMEQLRQLGEDMRDEMRELFEGMRDLSEEERRERFGDIREKMDSLRQNMETKMNDVLLPHQVDRLKQIGVQMDVQRRGVSGALERGELAEQLNITEEQMEQLREKAQEVQEKLQERVNKLRQEAQDDILSVLTPEQRATYKRLVGDPFTMQQPRFGRGGPGGGRRGGDGERPERD